MVGYLGLIDVVVPIVVHNLILQLLERKQCHAAFYTKFTMAQKLTAVLGYIMSIAHKNTRRSRRQEVKN